MALTITPSTIYPNDVWGSVNVNWVNALPAVSDYTTGGYTLTPGQGIGLGVIYFIIPVGGQAGYVPVLNPATGKLQVWESAAGAGELQQVPNGADLSAVTFTLLLFGR
jgi:hypothetical protein